MPVRRSPISWRSRRSLLVLVSLAAGGISTNETSRADDAPVAFAKGGLPFVRKHCLECHNEKTQEGSLSLASFVDDGTVVKSRKMWLKSLQRIESGEMPPEEKPRPTKAEIEAFVASVRNIYEHHDKNAKPDPGRVTARRLNRVEYANTVRDLLLADFNPTENFPADDIGHGFDNIGDVLTVSPLLMERYLDAAESIANRVILVNPPKPSRRYLSGRFLQPNNAQTPQGRFRPMDPTSTDPTVSGPFAAPGDYLKLLPGDELILRANLYAETADEAPVKVALFLQGKDLKDASTDAEVDQLMGAALASMKPMRILQIFEITSRDAKKPQQIEFALNDVAGINRAGLALVKPAEGTAPAKLHVEHIWSEGPMETRPPSQRMLLAVDPNLPDVEKTRLVLGRFLRRAYRRPATKDEVDRLAALVEAEVAGGAKWEAGVQRAILATLCSPKFLFRIETDDQPESAAIRPLDEFALASRMSYFLWSSMPDDELLDLAEKKQLTAQMDAQVSRMLKSDKARALVESFGLQWLQLQRLKIFAPDPERFPTFNDRLRAAMTQETVLFFGEIVREDRSVLDLLDADFTWLNEPLARHYGITDTMGNRPGMKTPRKGGQPIRGENFVRVSLADGQRGGLPTQAGILAVTSNPTRTSPVKRGKWILEQILGDPPPPPPPNVPELAEGDKAQLTGSLRQRMEQHRKNVACAQCHARMDPIGFAFENYDAIGAWRTKDGDFDLETAGELPDGSKFEGPAEFKQILKQRKEAFSRCLIEKLMTYGLGRGLEYYDRPVIDRVQANLAKGDYRFSVLVSEIVKSEPFRMRRGVSVSP